MTESNDYDLKPQPSKPVDPVESVTPEEPADSTPPPPTSPKAVIPEKSVPPEEDPDVVQNKGMAILAYLGILVLVPLVFGQHSKFIRHHTNQGLLLLVLEVIAWVCCKTIMLLGYPILHLTAMVYLTSFIGGLIWLFFGIISLLGLMHVATGSFAELPIIGDYEIINVEGRAD